MENTVFLLLLFCVKTRCFDHMWHIYEENITVFLFLNYAPVSFPDIIEQRLMRGVEKQIHGLWCSVASLFIPALKRILKELIARAYPRKVTQPGAIPNNNNQTYFFMFFCNKKKVFFSNLPTKTSLSKTLKKIGPTYPNMFETNTSFFQAFIHNDKTN